MKDIIQLSTGSSNVLMVSLPEGVVRIEIIGNELYYLKNNWSSNVKRKKLPPGNWIEVGWSDELNDEQLKEILSYVKFGNGNRFMDYRIGVSAFLFETPLESWQSLLSANNIKERKFVLRDNK